MLILVKQSPPITQAQARQRLHTATRACRGQTSRAAWLVSFCLGAIYGLAPAYAQVTPQAFGARGDGVTDDTAAFRAALAAGPVHVPAGHYVVDDLVIPSGGVLEGAAGMIYASAQQINTSILAKRGASRVLNVEGSQNVVITGIVVDGANTGADCISGGSQFMVLMRVTALRCDHGLGSKASSRPTDAYTHAATIIGSEFAESVIGVSNLIDSTMFGGAISADGIGLLLGNGANANNFIALRTEWCKTYNISIRNANDIQFQGGISDRGGLAGAYLSGATRIQFTGVIFRRNGADDAGDLRGDSQIVLDSGNTEILMSAPLFESGSDDQGRPPISPKWGITYLGTNDLVLITGGDFSGATIAFSRGAPPTRLRISDNSGVIQTPRAPSKR